VDEAEALNLIIGKVRKTKSNEEFLETIKRVS
jgi:transcription termination factor Rho